MAAQKTDEQLLTEVAALAEPLGASAIGIGPDAVAVMGDARFYGPCVFVKFPAGYSMEEIGRLSTLITNTVTGISRVMMEI
jgi:hypothetical protein